MHDMADDSDEEDDDEPPRLKKWSKEWGLRRVVQNKMSRAIKQRMEELAEEAGETTHLIKLYPVACTQICNELSEEERCRFEDLADLWNRQGVPEDIQQK
jgi:hypothetical protein